MRTLFDRPAIGPSRNNCEFVDEYSYAALMANQVRAEECINDNNNIEHHYDREGWIRLLLHYIHYIDLMIDEYPQAITYIDVVDYNKLLLLREKTQLKVSGIIPYHYMPIGNKYVLEWIIKAIKILRTIFDIELKLDYVKAEYYKVKNLEPVKEYNIGDSNKKYCSKKQTQWYSKKNRDIYGDD
jgi:hypothetical protein